MRSWLGEQEARPGHHVRSLACAWEWRLEYDDDRSMLDAAWHLRKAGSLMIEATWEWEWTSKSHSNIELPFRIQVFSKYYENTTISKNTIVLNTLRCLDAMNKNWGISLKLFFSYWNFRLDHFFFLNRDQTKVFIAPTVKYYGFAILCFWKQPVVEHNLSFDVDHSFVMNDVLK